MHNKIIIIANTAAAGTIVKGDKDRVGLSGGDRILIEFVKYASNYYNIFIFTGKGGMSMYKRYFSDYKVEYILTSSITFKSFSIVNTLLYDFITMMKSIFIILTHRRDFENCIIYSASNFFPDVLPSLPIKLFSGNKLIGTEYLFYPKPLSKTSPYKCLKGLVKNILLYCNQKITHYLIRRFSDMIWVTNDIDKMKISADGYDSSKIIVVKGGVDNKLSSLVQEPKNKEFDAVFIGRLHPQKGVLELIDIWDIVCKKYPSAKLAIIGNGDLEDEIKKKISRYGLNNNIILLGPLDGLEKVKIFKKSKIVVHPSIYDSGGMAAAEAMSCGLPGVSFDLEALKSYYPKGMLKTPCFDLEAFANNILKLLNDKNLYERLSKEALELAREWDWGDRAKYLLNCISLIDND